MGTPPNKSVRFVAVGASDIFVKEGQIFMPSTGMAYFIRTGYFSVEVDVRTTGGIVTFKLGTVEEEELLHEEELLPAHAEADITLRYRAEIDSVLLQLSGNKLPDTVQQLTLFVLKLARSSFRKQSHLYQLAAKLFQSKEELERKTKQPSAQQQALEREVIRLQKELRTARESAVAVRKSHAAELQTLRDKLALVEASKQKIIESLKEASHLHAKMCDEQVKQSNGVLHAVNQVLQKFKIPPIKPMDLLEIVSEAKPPGSGLRQTLIPATFGAPPPPPTSQRTEDVGPQTERWGPTRSK